MVFFGVVGGLGMIFYERLREVMLDTKSFSLFFERAKSRTCAYFSLQSKASMYGLSESGHARALGWAIDMCDRNCERESYNNQKWPTTISAFSIRLVLNVQNASIDYAPTLDISYARPPDRQISCVFFRPSQQLYPKLIRLVIWITHIVGHRLYDKVGRDRVCFSGQANNCVQNDYYVSSHESRHHPEVTTSWKHHSVQEKEINCLSLN